MEAKARSSPLSNAVTSVTLLLPPLMENTHNTSRASTRLGDPTHDAADATQARERIVSLPPLGRGVST